ncbi:MAG: glycosyltransferase [Massilia sp.]|jgi:glycosyltransferase involved in cell wall biosynthesis|nr:glycosyltransferase [Massilia sp.]MDB5950957.1 glycosyltransferase [Massilia sp.]
MTRVSILSHSDNGGGASRAAYRLYQALRAAGIDPRMTVRSKLTGDWTVAATSKNYAKAVNFARSRFGGYLMLLQKTPNANMHSTNVLPSNLSTALNASDAGVVNLHWLGGEAMSVEDIGRIRKPVVWTLHDMWAFCGAEHVTDYGVDARWRAGYYRGNRPLPSSGPDIDRFTWNRKRRAWKHPVHIVTPSRWLADCVRHSALMKDWPVTVIPNVLDTDVFKPLDRQYCRHVLNLPSDKRIVLFGAFGGGGSLNKGYDLLLDAMNSLAASRLDILCVVFGQSEPQAPPGIPFPIKWMGHVGDDPTLALLYGAADVMVIPSRLENLPQSGTEAHACGCPVVAFDCAGLPEVVDHRITGYLAEAYQTEDLARGIAWVLSDKNINESLGLAARAKAEKLWSAGSVVPAYLEVYEAARAMTPARPVYGVEQLARPE